MVYLDPERIYIAGAARDVNGGTGCRPGARYDSLAVLLNLRILKHG